MAENEEIEYRVRQVNSPERSSRWASCEGLGELRDVRAVEPLVQRLGDKDRWVRSDACEALGRLGDLRAVEPLIERLSDTSFFVSGSAQRALVDIFKTLGAHHELLCRSCLARFQRRYRDWLLNSEKVHGGLVPACRLCGKAVGAIPNVGVVIAVLDTEMGEELSSSDGVLRVSYLKRDAPFDFDRVEIVRASDYEVERFCVQVGNDTDPFRKGRYRQMQCLVAPGCRLSENTLRILGSMFGQVESRA